LIFTGVHPGASYFGLVLPGAIMSGLGMGLGLVSSTIAATQGVPRSQSGLASGLLNMSRLFGGALGLAVLSTLAASQAHAHIGISHAQALTNGFGLAFKVGALILLAAAAVAILQLRAAPAEEAPAAMSERQRSEEALAA
jgi:MFS family permease